MNSPRWDPVDGGECPYCGSENVLADTVKIYDSHGSYEYSYDIYQCGDCKRTLHEEQ